MFDIREYLRLYIEEHGLIQAVIAAKAGLTASQFSSVLKKSRKLDANELFKICKALYITPDQLKRYGDAKQTAEVSPTIENE